MEHHFLNALNELMEAYKVASGETAGKLRKAVRGLKAEFSQVFPEKVVVFDWVDEEYHINVKEA